MLMLREARLDDAPGIAETHVATWQATYRGLLPDQYLDELSVPRRAEFWRERLQKGHGATFVFEERDQIVAFADFGSSRAKEKDPTRSCELYAIYIKPEVQRRGLGRLLFERGLTWARGQGFTDMTTLVLKGNNSGHNFYRSMGMRDDGVELPDKIGGQDVLEVRLVIEL